jgi:hypothetical protein
MKKVGVGAWRDLFSDKPFDRPIHPDAIQELKQFTARNRRQQNLLACARTKAGCARELLPRYIHDLP